ncbi:acetolactate synthase isozyme 3 large subunit [bacterium BMS3Abin02]|nr:acetolactate synthase isozyme 3 large subunit [bacterium BMS3Abin02]
MGSVTGGDLIADVLATERVEKVFGLPDGTYMGLLNGLETRGISLVTPRHETTALHMAGAYARLTGRLGVAIASNGPGVANALPGVAVENAEGNRVLLITSSRRLAISDPDRGGAYQYFDQVGAITPIAKWSARASSAQRVPELLRTALRESFRGRPGVVHLDVPQNIMNGKTKPAAVWQRHRYRRVDPLLPDPQLVERAAQRLAEATLPIIHAGGGVIHARAHDQLAQVAELLHAPVTTSWSGRGSMSETSPLVWPITAIDATNEVRNAADVVLVLGSRIGETDWWGKAPNWRQDQQVIQVDVDEAAFGLNKPVDLAITSDAGTFLEALGKALEGEQDEALLDARRSEVDRLIASRTETAAKLDKHLEDRSVPMNTAHVPATCMDVFDDDAIFVVDGGNTAVWANFFLRVRTPGAMLSTPHFGMLGAGLGQALGAAEAFGDRQVCCIIGDGAFGFHPQEIETAVRNGNRIVFLVVSDRQWGMVKMSQSMARHPVKMMVRKSLDPDETINTELGEIGYDAMARSMGAHGERVADPAQLRPAIERSLAVGGCAVIHVDVDPKKHLWAPGLMHFKKMHQEPEGK